ncbi:carotenoid 1,2-hydratase [Shewanella inventionis]|uniref:Carotenoid 1,2-hydratase n=1 Tax=Shewanella inventionis TaxID=1738770 RepID=A0ABQ1IYA4_9GAMM|nr:lipocalin-like domain-containing protein [Shewanella inventionis]MCL1156971.1 carotenoid 1,2-hydratase [Shewanella inventionis]UAL43134.1 carotenoid 1,2-hydratase [Shewanella inventionis]GGB54222.1 carotenoid 1,2-hydratase [Shewanella inventionis]
MTSKIGKQTCFINLLTVVFCTLLSACSPAPEPHQKTSTISSMSAQSSVGYSKVTQGKNLTFPQDHLAHNDYKIEWWYLTANLTTSQGEDIGVQWTQFRIAMTPPQQPQAFADNTWSTNQLYMAHAAVTSKSEHLTAEKWSRAHPKLASVSPSPFTVHLQNWQWQSQSDDLFPATLTVNNPNFTYQLQLNSQQPIQLQGDKGYSSKSADQSVASYYYSQPFIDVTGEITRQGITEKVSGKAWLDREWSSQFLTKAQQGWDWFSLRLNDNSTLMAFRLRGNTEQNHFYSARRMYPNGSGRNINSRENPNDIEMQPTQWQQTALGRHPIAWRIQIHSESIDITTQAINPKSDMLVSTSYWEGPISIDGTHQGKGYMELTGYN